MQFPHQLFKNAGLNSTDVAYLCGVSRITGFRWLKGADRHGNDGVGVNIFLQDRVAKLTAQVQAAVDAGALPDTEITTMPPNTRVKKIRSVINQFRTKK